jgi:hypothetical protein
MVLIHHRIARKNLQCPEPDRRVAIIAGQGCVEPLWTVTATGNGPRQDWRIGLG